MRSHLPLLNSTEITAPCPMSWANMKGGNTRRYCDACELHVHDLSAMTAQEAETLLQTYQGELCVRYTQNHDGRIITDELPARLRPLRALVLKRGAMAGVAFALLILTAGARQASAQIQAQPTPAKTKAGKTKPAAVKSTGKKQETTKTQSKSAVGVGNPAPNAKTTAKKSEPVSQSAVAPTSPTSRGLGISTSLGRYRAGSGVPLSQKDKEKQDKEMLEVLQALPKEGILRNDLEKALDRIETMPNTLPQK